MLLIFEGVIPIYDAVKMSEKQFPKEGDIVTVLAREHELEVKRVNVRVIQSDTFTPVSGIEYKIVLNAVGVPQFLSVFKKLIEAESSFTIWELDTIDEMQQLW